MTKLQKQLKAFNACQEAIDWIGDRTAEQAWAECPDGSWMLWIIGKLEGTFTPAMRLCTCEIVRTQLHLIPPNEKRPLIAIETAERHARGEATDEELSRAAAWAASRAARAAWAAWAAEAAAWAAWAAEAAAGAAARAAWAAWAAEAAAWAAEAAAWAAEAAAGAAARAAARAAALKQFADIVRKHFPQPPKLERP